MLLAPRHRPPYWRTLLVLGRVSALPTVWSHCLAGWLLGGGGALVPLPLLLLGASCLYIAGMFLNDAFDAEFDRLHRKERPIPAGLITLDEVWQWGFGWLALGTVILVVLGNTTGAWVAILVICILLHDAIHKVIENRPSCIIRAFTPLPGQRLVIVRDFGGKGRRQDSSTRHQHRLQRDPGDTLRQQWDRQPVADQRQ